MAYWPGSGDLLTNINYSKCRVGVGKYFIKHAIKFQNDAEEHISVTFIGSRDIHLMTGLDNQQSFHQLLMK